MISKVGLTSSWMLCAPGIFSQETNVEVTVLGRVIDVYCGKKLDCFSTKEIRWSIWSASALGCTLSVLPLRPMETTTTQSKGEDKGPRSFRHEGMGNETH